MRWSSFLVVALFLAVAGCRGLPQPLSQPVSLTPPLKLPDEHRLPVGQLVFHSDFELPANHRLVRELEIEREDVSSTLGLPSTNEPINVYLFHDAEHYQEFLKRNFPTVPSRRAFFLETDTRLAVFAHWSDRVAEDLRHEVAHGYLHATVPGLPLWLDEGLAEYFEVPRGQGGLNRPHVDLLSDLAQHENWRPDLDRLEKLSDAAQMSQRDYAESWAWVYFFLNSPAERREILTDYLATLRDGGDGERLSARLAEMDNRPEVPLAKYLASLKQGALPR